jgi:malate dehydrogenase (oxaloacetate-decarboxylating)
VNFLMSASSENRPPTRKVNVAGFNLINSPRLNKGTAFTNRERDLFSLHGLLPPHVGTLEEQVDRRMRAFDDQRTAFHQYAFLRDLQDLNETLFYALLVQNIEKLLPIVYTPTVGEGCMRFSEIWRKPRGVFLSYPNKDRMRQILSHPRYDKVRCIVVSDGERILGLGDQGAGGMGIPIGKMALYTALGGIPPEQCLPVLLDVGTDNEERLQNPIYMGWKHERIRGQEYDDFVDAFVQCVKERWPHVLLQWEDFAGSNASRLLGRYRDQLCTFNDDIQGTAAIAAATLVSAIHVTGTRLAEQRIVLFGFGSAGLGIANLLVRLMQQQGCSLEQARARIYGIDVNGLLTEGRADMREEQLPYARAAEEVREWRHEGGIIDLKEVVRQARPTALIGVSGQAGAFAEEVVRTMAEHAERPIIFPLSNPTSRSEAHPHDLLTWTEGRALVGTGSPFEPMTIKGKTLRVAQTNNSYIFPGLALGIISAKARHVTEDMILAATTELIRHLPTCTDSNACLLPPIAEARAIARHIGEAVGRQALREGQAQVADEAELLLALDENHWDPAYEEYERE